MYTFSVNFGRIRGILLSMLGSWGAGMILCRLMGLSPPGAVVMLFSGTLGSVAGALSTGRKIQIGAVLFAVGLLCSAVLAIWWFAGYLLPLLTVGIYLLTMGALIVSGYGFYGPLGVWSTILLCLSVFASEFFGVLYSIVTGTAALLSLVLTLDGFRDSSMRKSQHKKRDHRYVDNPSHILQHSYFLAGLFLAAALAIGLLTFGLSSGLINAIKAIFTEGATRAGGVLGWIFRAIEAAIQWFSDLFPDLKDTHSGIAAGSSNEKPIYTGGPGSWLSTIIMVVCFSLGCLALSLIIGRLFLKRRKQPKISQEISDYEEEIESLERPKRRFPWQNRKVRQRYQDFQDPVMKVRYAFQQLLRHKQKNDGLVLVKTPNELLDPTVPEEESLIRAYNRVKYARGSVSTDELEAAERYLKRL